MDQQKLLRLYLPGSVAGVLSANRNSTERLLDSIEQLEFASRILPKIGNETEIELNLLGATTPFYKLLAGEASRFLLASRMSYRRALQQQDKNVSWQTIEHYYSAYFAAHYLLRLTGQSITNLDDNQVAVIRNNSLNSISKSDIIPVGLYLLSYNDSSKTIILRKTERKVGSHQALWKKWLQLVNNLIEIANLDWNEYATEEMNLKDHKNFLSNSNGFMFAPDIRAQINYQFKGGTWHFEKDAASVSIVQRSIQNTSPVRPIVTPTPLGLISNNKLIIELAKAVFNSAAQNYPKSFTRSLKNEYAEYF